MNFASLPPVYRMGVVILILLVVASLIVAVLKKRHPERNYGELSARTKSWWVMAAVFFAAISIHSTLSLAFFALLSFWALKEYFTLLKTRPADHRALFWAFLAIPLQYFWIWDQWYGMFVLFIPVYMFLWIPIRLVLAKEPSGFVDAASHIHWGLMTFVFGLSHLGMMLQLPGVPGRALVLFVVVITEMSDVLQYVWGKTCGRHRIIPSISPNKTWEGFVGGVVSCTLLSLFIRFLTPFTLAETLWISFMICVAGFMGGAVMSAVKRDLGVKDFGSIIPGHGGILDRVDSLCFAVPLFFHYVRYFHT